MGPMKLNSVEPGLGCKYSGFNETILHIMNLLDCHGPWCAEKYFGNHSGE
jgi:hypothetical protein